LSPPIRTCGRRTLSKRLGKRAILHRVPEEVIDFVGCEIRQAQERGGARRLRDGKIKPALIDPVHRLVPLLGDHFGLCTLRPPRETSAEFNCRAAPLSVALRESLLEQTSQRLHIAFEFHVQTDPSGSLPTVDGWTRGKNQRRGLCSVLDAMKATWPNCGRRPMTFQMLGLVAKSMQIRTLARGAATGHDAIAQPP
jgi:hypothetical protein